MTAANGKQVVRVTVVGPVQCGKSLVLAHVKQALTNLGANVMADNEVSTLGLVPDIRASLADWEVKMIRGYDWVLEEKGPTLAAVDMPVAIQNTTSDYLKLCSPEQREQLKQDLLKLFD